MRTDNINLDNYINSYNNYDSTARLDRKAIENTVNSLFDRAITRKSSDNRLIKTKELIGESRKTEIKAKRVATKKITKKTTGKIEGEKDSKTQLSTPVSADKNGNINEEQLQSAIVQYLLGKKDSKLGKAYLQELSKSLAGGKPLAGAVKAALKSLVQKGLITEAQAEEINGMSFDFAQLDNNLSALYDSKGSAGDDSIAIMEMEKAVSKAMSSINEASSLDQASSRSLEAISNSVSINNSSSSSNNGNGFLWKPISESNGNLVVLFPPNLTGNISSAGIYTSLPPSYENLVEKGSFSGDNHNGGRAHFRFSKPGGAYPDGVYVVAQLNNGQSATFEIDNSSSRN